MLYNLIFPATFLIALVLCVYCYTLGVKHGRTVSNGGVPRVEINPIKAIQGVAEDAKAKKEKEAFNDEFSEIMGLNKERMLEAVARDRAEKLAKGRN